MDANRKIFVVLGSVAVIATAGLTAGKLLFGGNQSATSSSNKVLSSTSQSASTTPTSVSSTGTSSNTATSTTYKDGTYTATSSYDVPHGNTNQITTKLTIANGVVTAVSVQDDISDRESQSYVDWFEQDLKSEVVGKRVANLSPSRIGGASLTTDAFNSTLDTIRTNANA